MKKETKIFNAIDFIEDHLTEGFSPEDVCSHAFLSRRHLYREFKKLTGDSIMNYVRLRRLTMASKELVNTQQSVLDLALKYQFESPEGFSRAFSKTFWRSPRDFRVIGSPYSATQKTPFQPDFFDVIGNRPSEEPIIITTPPRIMAGIKIIQPHYGFRVEENLEEGENLGETLQSILGKIPHLVDGSEWNIAFRRTANLKQHEIENVFAVEVKRISPHFFDLEYINIPACQYAVFPHHGHSTLVEFTVSAAFQWLSQSPFFLGDAPSMFHISPGQRFAGDLMIPISTEFKSNLHWWEGYDPTYIAKIGNWKK